MSMRVTVLLLSALLVTWPGGVQDGYMTSTSGRPCEETHPDRALPEIKAFLPWPTNAADQRSPFTAPSRRPVPGWMLQAAGIARRSSPIGEKEVLERYLAGQPEHEGIDRHTRTQLMGIDQYPGRAGRE